MGQHTSCIQGKPDWLGPYEKTSGKSQDSEFYEKIRKLAINSGSKDFSDLESFLKNKINPSCPQHGSLTLLPESSSVISAIPKDSALPNKLEDIFHKESHCKDVNFSQEQRNTKVASIKPIIVKKSTCAIHGTVSSREVHAKQHTACRVHGSQNSKMSVTDKDYVKQNYQSKRMPPSYRYPPKIESPPEPAQKKFIVQNTTHIEKDDDNDTSGIFSCPDFLMNLIMPTEEPETKDVLASVGVQSAKETIQRLEDRAESIVETFGVVLKHLEHGDWSTFCISTSRLCEDIRKVLKDYHLNSEESNTDAMKIKNHVTSAMNQLTMNILSLSQKSLTETNHHALLPSFKNLGEVLHEVMEFLISKELKVLVDCMQDGTNNFCMKMAVCALAEMSLSGELMCKLIVQAGTIPSLLNICKVKKYNYLRPLALRTLTVICSFEKALEEFEKLSGVDTAINIIDNGLEEKVLCETVGLLAQILKQWSENKCSLPKKLGHHLNQLVKTLTGTAQKALSPETFLLAAACLATLSSCSTEATNWLHLHAQEMRLLASNTKQESYV